MLPVGGAKRPLWVTPFVDDDAGGIVFADAESGHLWVGIDIGEYSPLGIIVSNASEFVPRGLVQTVVRNESQGSVALSEVIRHFPVNIQKDVMQAFKRIHDDVITMYSR